MPEPEETSAGLAESGGKELESDAADDQKGADLNGEEAEDSGCATSSSTTSSRGTDEGQTQKQADTEQKKEEKYSGPRCGDEKMLS